MSERELIAMMAATIRAADFVGAAGSVDEAEAILREIDARAAARREPPSRDLKEEDWP
jgi:hypothetical protein